MTRDEANTLTDALYKAGFDVTQEVVHPIDHPASQRKETGPWVTLRVSGASPVYTKGDLFKIVDAVVAQGMAEQLTFSVHDGIVIR